MCGLVCGVCVLRPLHTATGRRGETIAQNNAPQKQAYASKRTASTKGPQPPTMEPEKLQWAFQDLGRREDRGWNWVLANLHITRTVLLFGNKSTPKMDIIGGNLISKQENKRDQGQSRGWDRHCKCNYLPHLQESCELEIQQNAAPPPKPS